MADQTGHDQGELVLTYAELAARLGVSTDGARTKARRAGWSVARGNDGRARVRVRASELPEQTGVATGQTGRSDARHDRRRSTTRAVELAELLAEVADLRDLRLADREKLARAEGALDAAATVAEARISAARTEARALRELADRLTHELHDARLELAKARLPWLARLWSALRAR